MSEKITISLDAMGGDNAPLSVIEGASLIAESRQNLFFLFFGDKKKLSAIIKKYRNLDNRYELIHTKDVIGDEQAPSIAFRKGKASSMRKAIDAVKEGRAQACISAGNTGALMVTAKMVLRMLDKIERPAIIGIFPNIKKTPVILDLGANTECKPQHLLQFAVMGQCFYKSIFAVEDPSIAILNVGKEEMKGRELEKETYDILKRSGLNFIGNIEANKILSEEVDVIVTDGFSGNIMLKTAEGVGELSKTLIKQAFNATPLTKLGGLLAKKGFKAVFNKIDPRHHNGAMLVGLDGIVVKSHGNSDGTAFANAIKITADLITHDINNKIADSLTKIGEQNPTIFDRIRKTFGIG